MKAAFLTLWVADAALLNQAPKARIHESQVFLVFQCI